MIPIIPDNCFTKSKNLIISLNMEDSLEYLRGILR